MPLDTLGPYDLGAPLGKGGMGSVYRATHRETGAEVAVKVLSPRLAVSEGFRDRFESEIESLKALRHAGIVRLFGYGEEEETLFYAMELVEGPSLEEELRNGRRFSWRETTQIAIQVCHALKHAHDHGVVHRDLKPANILLAPGERAKLADFGIARVFGSTGVTIAGGVLGTADYMSPEQAAGKPVTARCDQYSLAGVMYALLTGRPPFRAEDLAAMLQLQRFAVAEPLRRYAPDTPEELERIVAKMLEKDPTDRFPNTRIIARRLEAMNQALSSVGADDFELRTTGLGQSDEDADEDELQLAMTRDANDADTPEPHDSAATLPAPTPVTPAVATSGASYTHVEPDSQVREQASSWSAIVGQALVLAIALGTLGGAAWWFTRPVTADMLHSRIAVSVSNGDANPRTLEAIREFGVRFSDDPRADEVAEWGQAIRLEQMRRRMKLSSRLEHFTKEASLEESLLRHASELAARDPEAGADAYERVATLLSVDGDDALLNFARDEAVRLREEAASERKRLAEFCLEKLSVSKEGPDAASVARAVLAVLPEGPETKTARDAALETLAGEATASSEPPVAPDEALR